MAENSNKKNKLVIVSGPSGVGKTSICRRLAEKLDAFLSVSVTTRPPGKNETEGLDYHFIPHDEFQRLIDQDELLEYAQIFENYYGTPKQPVEQALRRGKIVILEIDANGALQVKEQFPETLMIFVLPPTQAELADRINNRGRESEQARDARLQGASSEIARAWQHYQHMVINDDLEQAVNETIQIINKHFPENRND